MRIGGMRQRIKLQSFTNTTDNMGGFTKTWTTEAIVPAAIWPVSAKERIRSESPTMTTTHRIQIRYYEGLSPKWRVMFGSRYFNIVSIINKEERNIQMDLLCEEASA